MSQPLIMSFRPDAAAMCLDGRKTMTRRIWKDGMSTITGFRQEKRANGELILIPCQNICGIGKPGGGRLLWHTGSSIAIKPKRAACAVGRVMCTGLRVEHVQNISEEDARREGVEPVWFDSAIMQDDGHFDVKSYRRGFENVWKRLNPAFLSPHNWDSNPLVVVIEFRPLKEGEK